MFTESCIAKSTHPIFLYTIFFEFRFFRVVIEVKDRGGLFNADFLAEILTKF